MKNIVEIVTVATYAFLMDRVVTSSHHPARWDLGFHGLELTVSPGDTYILCDSKRTDGKDTFSGRRGPIIRDPMGVKNLADSARAIYYYNIMYKEY